MIGKERDAEARAEREREIADPHRFLKDLRKLAQQRLQIILAAKAVDQREFVVAQARRVFSDTQRVLRRRA